MKREIPVLIVFVSGLLMVAQYFVPHAASEFLSGYAGDWIIVIGILSLPIGIYSLLGHSIRKVRTDRDERIYALATLAGFAIMVLTGLRQSWSKAPDGLHQLLFQNVLVPAQATLFAMLAFYVASAAYRAFRVRTLLAGALLTTAFVVMLRIIPLPDPLGAWNRDLVAWILAVPNMAAKRAIVIGVALGAVAYSIKILLGIERSYMGRD